MEVSWLIRLVFLTINVLMAVVLVISNSDFCASVYKTQTGKLTPVALLNGLLTPFPRRKQNTAFLKSLVFSRVLNTRHFNKSEMTISHKKHFKKHFILPTISDVKITYNSYHLFLTSDDSHLYQPLYLLIIKDHKIVQL